jgi:hypothetical protein
VRFLLHTAHGLTSQPLLMQYDADGFQEAIAMEKRKRAEVSGEGAGDDVKMRQRGMESSTTTAAAQIGKLRQKATEEEEESEEELEMVNRGPTEAAPVRRQVRANVNLSRFSVSLLDATADLEEESKRKVGSDSQASVIERHTIASLLCVSLAVNVFQAEGALEVGFCLKDISLSDSVGSPHGQLRPLLAIQPVANNNEMSDARASSDVDSNRFSISGEYKQRETTQQFRHPVGVPMRAASSALSLHSKESTKSEAEVARRRGDGAEVVPEQASLRDPIKQKRGKTRVVDAKEVTSAVSVRIARVTVIPRPRSLRYFMKVQSNLMKELEAKNDQADANPTETSTPLDDDAKKAVVSGSPLPEVVPRAGKARCRLQPLLVNRSEMTIAVSLHSIALDLTKQEPAAPTVQGSDSASGEATSAATNTSSKPRDASLDASSSTTSEVHGGGVAISQFRLSFSNLNLALKLKSAKTTVIYGPLLAAVVRAAEDENVGAEDEDRITLGFTFSGLLLEDLREKRYAIDICLYFVSHFFFFCTHCIIISRSNLSREFTHLIVCSEVTKMDYDCITNVSSKTTNIQVHLASPKFVITPEGTRLYDCIVSFLFFFFFLILLSYLDLEEDFVLFFLFLSSFSLHSLFILSSFSLLSLLFLSSFSLLSLYCLSFTPSASRSPPGRHGTHRECGTPDRRQPARAASATPATSRRRGGNVVGDFDAFARAIGRFDNSRFFDFLRAPSQKQQQQ